MIGPQKNLTVAGRIKCELLQLRPLVPHTTHTHTHARTLSSFPTTHTSHNPHVSWASHFEYLACSLHCSGSDDGRARTPHTTHTHAHTRTALTHIHTHPHTHTHTHVECWLTTPFTAVEETAAGYAHTHTPPHHTLAPHSHTYTHIHTYTLHSHCTYTHTHTHTHTHTPLPFSAVDVPAAGRVCTHTHTTHTHTHTHALPD